MQLTKEDVSNFGMNATEQLRVCTASATVLTRCKRKAVIAMLCQAQLIQEEEGARPSLIPRILHAEVNGPMLSAIECSGPDQDPCGCMHAEVRLMLRMLEMGLHHNAKLLVVTNYSPCTKCIAAIVTMWDYIKGVIYGELTLHDTQGLAHAQHYLPCLSAKELIFPTSKTIEIVEKDWMV